MNNYEGIFCTIDTGTFFSFNQRELLYEDGGKSSILVSKCYFKESGSDLFLVRDLKY
jgi:hypothetical protein